MEGLNFKAKRSNLSRILNVFWEKGLVTDEAYADIVIRLLNARTDDDLTAIATDIQAVCKGQSYCIKMQKCEVRYEAAPEKKKGEVGNAALMVLAICVLFAGLALSEEVSKWFLIPGAIGLCVLLWDCRKMKVGKEDYEAGKEGKRFLGRKVR